jgi:MarR family transcriptional regulator, organic hydroperoxide resistance regulator
MQLIEFLQINELLDILSGKLSASLNRLLSRKFREAGIDISPEQWLVMLCLWTQDKITQQDISDQTSKDKASITRLLDTLSRHDLIERHSSSNDRRMNHIHLTNKGRELEQKAMEIVRESFDQAINGVSEKDLLFMRKIVVKLLNNLSIQPNCQ